MKILFWPFRMLWSLLGGILQLTGRLLCGVLGFVFLVVGLILSVTVIGAVVGVPLLIVGLLLLIRSFF